MKLTTSSAASLREALCKIVELYSGEDDQLVSTDFYLMPLREEGALRVFNDNDEEIASVAVDFYPPRPVNWFNNSLKGEEY